MVAHARPVAVASRAGAQTSWPVTDDEGPFALGLQVAVSVSVTRYGLRAVKRKSHRARNKPDCTRGPPIRCSESGRSQSTVTLAACEQPVAHWMARRPALAMSTSGQALLRCGAKSLTAPIDRTERLYRRSGIGGREGSCSDARASVLNYLRILWHRLVGFCGPERSAAADRRLGERDKWHFTSATSCD
jgi:hypothetical protein